MTSPGGTVTDCSEALRGVVGDGHVRAARPDDAIDGVAPRWVVEPGSGDELSGVLGVADAMGLRAVARGGGTKLDWGSPPRALDVVVSTRRLDRVLEHAAGDMTATVQAGCSVAAVATALAERGQRLAVDPLWPGEATVGGILATNDGGALRTTFGPLRDHLIGVTVALADGTLARSGGKVVKNVAGYDLPKLFIGSYGTLGVIAEATFRLYPRPRGAETVCFVAPTPEELGRMLAAMTDGALATTAVQVCAGDDRPTTVIVLVEGLVESVQEKVRRVTAAVTAFGARPADVPADAWQAGELLFREPDTCVCQFAVLPTRVPAVCDLVNDVATRLAVRWEVVAQIIGAGRLRLASPQVPARLAAVGALREGLASLGGSLQLLRCPAGLKARVDVWPDAGDALPLMRRVKAEFDPKGTLSPGRFVGGI